MIRKFIYFIDEFWPPILGAIFSSVIMFLIFTSGIEMDKRKASLETNSYNVWVKIHNKTNVTFEEWRAYKAFNE